MVTSAHGVLAHLRSGNPVARAPIDPVGDTSRRTRHTLEPFAILIIQQDLVGLGTGTRTDPRPSGRTAA
jgi:hypothetical protein